MPEVVSKLNILRTLSLSDNQFAAFPEVISRLNYLTSLDLKGNQLDALPDVFSRLLNLTSLDLSNNQLAAFPEVISRLKNLTSLYLRGNELASFPEAISRISNLTSLDLSHNQLATLPELISRLTNLTYLDLSSNQFTTLPEFIVNVVKLKNLVLRNNPITFPPPEVVEMGLDAIRNYFKQLKKSKSEEFLYEAKMVITGRGNVGKTVLTKKLTIPDYHLTKEDSTLGAHVLKNPFKLNMADLQNADSFRFNIWDFGGQEKYDATHQFFITDRSIYLLLTEARAEDTNADFEYWLNTIKLLGEESPVIVVITKIDDRRKQFPKTKYKEQYPNIIDFVEISCIDGKEQTIKKLKEKIEEAVLLLPQYKQKFPNMWVDVRKRLEEISETKDYINYQDYLKICSENSLNEEEAVFLSGFLNSLGVIIHHVKDPILKDTVIVNIDWGIDGVYKILDNKNVIENNGHFSKEDLELIWDEKRYNNKHEELLRLMLNYKLCFECRDYSGYIAPTLLPYDRPEGFSWNNIGNLRFEYHYGFMPAGLLSRFIVEAHMWIDGKLFWKDGVVLKFDDTYAFIEEDSINKKIKVKLRGKNKRGLLGSIRMIFASIHKVFGKLEYTEMIPCNCSVCTLPESKTPKLFPLPLLEQYEKENRTLIDCENGTVKSVEVVSLMHDIKTRRQEEILFNDKQNYQYFIENVNIKLRTSRDMILENPEINGGKNYFADEFYNKSSKK